MCLMASEEKFYRHLKERDYYEKLYDECTISACKRCEDMYHSFDISDLAKKTKTTKKEATVSLGKFFNMHMWFEKGARADKKNASINEWMERDRLRDERLENTKAPKEVLCMECGVYMQEEYRHLETAFEKDEEEKLMFLMRCPECKEGQWAYEDGKKRPRQKQECPKCSGAMKRKSSECKDNKHITVYQCLECKNQEIDEYDLSKDEPNPEEVEKELRQFRIDREKYCLSEEGLREYRDGMQNLEQMKALVEEFKKDDGIRDELKSVKKLSVIALEKHLKSTLRKSGFDRIRLSEPNTGAHVTVGFKARETKEDRSEHQSKTALKKAINKALGKTNWTVMPSGISSRLGVLECQLKGCESEDQIKELVRNRREKNKS